MVYIVKDYSVWAINVNILIPCIDILPTGCTRMSFSTSIIN